MLSAPEAFVKRSVEREISVTHLIDFLMGFLIMFTLLCL